MNVFDGASVAIKQYWPSEKVAEHEVISRLQKAFANLGVSTVLVDENGKRVDGKGQLLEGQVLFCLDLHFKTPRVFSGLSVGALWNPIDFYSMFGATTSIANQISHDIFVAANPKTAGWIRNFRPDQKAEFLQLSHTVSRDSIRVPNLNPSSQVVYVGIGWDKLTRSSGRHHGLLSSLDQSGRLKIFGPKRLANGLRPWREFTGYSGSLPFDGESVLQEINTSGFALCLSSDSHKADGIQSNRLFETIAAGSLPIIEEGAESPFSLEGAIEIPKHLDDETAADFIIGEVDRLSSNQADFNRRVLGLQKRLESDFTLEAQLMRILVLVEQKIGTRPVPKPLSGDRCFSVIDALAKFHGVEPDVLDPNQLHALASNAAKKFVIELLMDSNAPWIHFGQSSDRIEACFSESDYAEYQVIWLNGTYHSKSGPISAVNTLQNNSSMGRCVIGRATFIELLDSGDPLISLPALVAIVEADLHSPKPLLKHHLLFSPQVSFLDASTTSARSISPTLDFVSISNLNQSESTLGSIVRNHGQFTNSSVPQNLQARDIFTALSRIRARDLSGIVLAGLKSLFRKS